MQEKTPFKIYSDTYITSKKNILVFVTDALGEFVFRRLVVKKGFEVISEIMGCQSDEDFFKLMTYYRESCNMKNDDIAVCIIKDE